MRLAWLPSDRSPGYSVAHAHRVLAVLGEHPELGARVRVEVAALCGDRTGSLWAGWTAAAPEGACRVCVEMERTNEAHR